MKKSNNPLSVQSKERIMTALLELSLEKPFNQITITEISSQSQLARRTFYRNFDTKEAILDLYIQKLISEYIELLGQEDTLKIYNVARVYFTFWNTLIKWVHEGAKKTPDQMGTLVDMIINDTILE